MFPGDVVLFGDGHEFEIVEAEEIVEARFVVG